MGWEWGLVWWVRVGVGAVMVCLLELGVMMGDEWSTGIVIVCLLINGEQSARKGGRQMNI